MKTLDVASRCFDLVATFSVWRLSRSLQDLIAYPVEMQGRRIGLYLHVHGLGTTTPAGRSLFGMLSAFSEFERSMIRDRVVAGLNRTRAKGTRLGRPPMPAERVEAIRAMLGSGKSIREVARATGAVTASVQRFRATMQAETGQNATAA